MGTSQAIGVIIQINKIKVHIICVYLPPNDDNKIAICKEIFEKTEDIEADFTIWIGDFNIDFKNHQKCENLKNLFWNNNFTQIIKNVTTRNNTILDLIFVNDLEIVDKAEIIDNLTSKCDHYSLELKLKVPISSNSTVHNHRKYNILDENKFKISLDRILLESSGQEDVEYLSSSIQLKLLESINSNTENKIHKSYKKTKIDHLLSMKTFYFKCHQYCVEDGDKKIFLSAKDSIYSIIKEENIQAKNKQLEYLINKNSDFSEFYRQMKKLNKSNVPEFIKKGDIVLSGPQIPEAFKEKLARDSEIYDENFQEKYNRYNNIDISLNDLLIAVKDMNNSASLGPSLFPIKIIKLFADKIAPILIELFRSIIRESKVPSSIKIFEIILILKFGKSIDLLESYRATILANKFFKILDLILYKKIISISINHNLLDPLQYGFIPGIGTHNQIIDLSKIIYQNLDSQYKEIHLIFFDLSDAFGSIKHKLLFDKLFKIGFGGNLLNILREMICENTYYINWNNM